MTAPCKDCEQRHQACWDSCERYAEYREQLRTRKEQQTKDTDVANYIAARNAQFAKITNHNKRR